jgi:hypothetical protein
MHSDPCFDHILFVLGVVAADENEKNTRMAARYWLSR